MMMMIMAVVTHIMIVQAASKLQQQ